MFDLIKLDLNFTKGHLVNRQKQLGFAHLGIITIVLALGLIGTLGFVFYQNFIQKNNNSNISNASLNNKNTPSNNSKSNSIKTLLAGDFAGSNGNYSGMFQAEGYASIATRNITGDTGECIDNPCKTVRYLDFKILRVENKNLANFISDNTGNSFANNLSLGVGCVSNGEISYYNDSDVNGWRQYVINKADSSTIINSTSSKPVVLEITKLKYSYGHGAPVCTSLFTDFKIVN